jgi:hypothetical protein
MDVPELFGPCWHAALLRQPPARRPRGQRLTPRLLPDLQAERLAALHQVIDETQSRAACHPRRGVSRLNIELVGTIRADGLDSGSATCSYQLHLEHYRRPSWAILEECRASSTGRVMSHFIDLSIIRPLDPAIGVTTSCATPGPLEPVQQPAALQNRCASRITAPCTGGGLRIVTETIRRRTAALAPRPLTRISSLSEPICAVLVWQVSVPVSGGLRGILLRCGCSIESTNARGWMGRRAFFWGTSRLAAREVSRHRFCFN